MGSPSDSALQSPFTRGLLAGEGVLVCGMLLAVGVLVAGGKETYDTAFAPITSVLPYTVLAPALGVLCLSLISFLLALLSLYLLMPYLLLPSFISGTLIAGACVLVITQTVLLLVRTWGGEVWMPVVLLVILGGILLFHCIAVLQKCAVFRALVKRKKSVRVGEKTSPSREEEGDNWSQQSTVIINDEFAPAPPPKV